MAETQNVFVTKTQNRFLPIIQAFTDNLYKNMQMQGELNEKQLAFNKQVQNEQFIKDYGKKITQAKSLEELTGTLSAAVTDAGSRGLTNALPIIQSIAQVHQQSIGLEEANKQANEYVGLLSKTYGGSMVLQDGKPVPFKDAVTSLESIKDPISRRMNAEFLAKNILKEYKDVVPEGKEYKYTSGFVGADGKTYDIQQYNIIEDKKRGVLIDSDQTAGVSEGDQPLDPLVAKQYGLYKKQDKQLEAYMNRIGGSGTGGVNTQPSKWYEDPKTKEVYAAWWDKKSNRYKTLVDGKEMIVSDNSLIKDRTATTRFKEMSINNLGIVSDLQSIASETGKGDAIKMLNQQMIMNPGFYKEVPPDILEDFARSLAMEMGDNWDNPKNPKLLKLKQRFGTTVNPFTQQLFNIFGTIKDSSYTNNILQD